MYQKTLFRDYLQMAFIILVLLITPNGKQIILSGDVDTSENQDRSLESEIFIMDAEEISKCY
jgi:hypothetical protein